MPIQYATPASPVIQYDGTNSAELVAAFGTLASSSAEIQSEADGILTLNVTYWEGGGNEVGVGTPYPALLTIPTGGWVMVYEWPSVIPAAEFAERWILKP